MLTICLDKGFRHQPRRWIDEGNITWKLTSSTAQKSPDNETRERALFFFRFKVRKKKDEGTRERTIDGLVDYFQTKELSDDKRFQADVSVGHVGLP